MKRHALAWCLALLVGAAAAEAPVGGELAGRSAEAPAAATTSADPAPAEATGLPTAPSLLASAQAVVAQAEPEPAPGPRPQAFEYSDGYRTRLKIHKYASYATLPLFAAQYAVGQKLYDGNASDGTRSAHGALAAGTAALFAVNTVTGVWNLREGRKDPNHHNKRMVHGMLMLAADAGFVATGMLAPESELGESSGNRSTHRTVALTSMGVATVAYLMMLFGH